ncbi:MAG: CRISPR system precrRNA processing endoribonuclease RAMP protein Cas6, partial [Caldiserica bacterium]|nr:CRISPR system precrRNA processing endoribonuclease RAMP protein Cas6 [Caldisericota bacterium]
PACKNCPLNQNCPYAVVFESSPPANSTIMRDFSDTPRPFVIEPENDSRTEYLPGETFFLDLIIFGKALDLFPYFLLAFRELASQGIGKMRGRASLEKLEFQGGEGRQLVYQVEDNLIRTGWQPETGKSLKKIFQELIFSENDHITLCFQTMTRLINKGHLVEIPHFHIVFRNLVRRVSALLYFYHGMRMDLDYGSLFSEAEKVKLVKNETVWVDWARYSKRQQEKMFMGGLLGRATYLFDGVNPSVFLPFVILGEITHVGKGAVFGLGKYRVETLRFCLR